MTEKCKIHKYRFTGFAVDVPCTVERWNWELLKRWAGCSPIVQIHRCELWRSQILLNRRYELADGFFGPEKLMMYLTHSRGGCSLLFLMFWNRKILSFPDIFCLQIGPRVAPLTPGKLSREQRCAFEATRSVKLFKDRLDKVCKSVAYLPPCTLRKEDPSTDKDRFSWIGDTSWQIGPFEQEKLMICHMYLLGSCTCFFRFFEIEKFRI